MNEEAEAPKMSEEAETETPIQNPRHKKWPYIIIIVLMLVILSGAYLFFMRINESDPASVPVSKSDDPCNKMDNEQMCFENPNCRSVFRSSCMGCMDLIYDGCVSIDPEVLSQVAKEKKLCEDTGGTWQRSEHDDAGWCGCLSFAENSIFTKKGCATRQTICSELPKTEWIPWSYEEDAFGQIEKYPDHFKLETAPVSYIKNKGACNASKRATNVRWNEWDDKKGECIQYKIEGAHPKCIMDGQEIKIYENYYQSTEPYSEQIYYDKP